MLEKDPLKRPVPDGFDNLAKALLDIDEGSDRNAKRNDWNRGRHIAYFMDSDHAEKYGRRTVEQLGELIGRKTTTLYTFARVYKAYASDRAFARVLQRDKVTSSMLGALADLGSDAQRDQVERHIQSSEKQMKFTEVRAMVNKMIGRGKSMDGRTTDPAMLCAKLYEKLGKNMVSMMALLNDAVQLESGLVKAAKKPDAEIPKAVLQRRKEALALVNKAKKMLEKYAGYVEGHDL